MKNHRQDIIKVMIKEVLKVSNKKNLSKKMKITLISIWKSQKIFAPIPKQERNSVNSTGTSATLVASLVAVEYVGYV